MNGTEEDHVVVDGTRVTFRAAGSGPPVVLIHGSGNGDGRDWQFSVFDELARNNRVVAFDRPGIGGSEAIAGGDGPRAQARHLARATAQLDLQAPLLAGHSYGGAVGLAWALGDGAIPAQVAPRGLMLLAAITHTPPPPPAIFRMLARSVISGPMAWLVCHPMRAGALKSLLSQTFAPQEPGPEYLDYAQANLLCEPSELIANAREMVALAEAIHQMLPSYGRLTMPVEILHGEADANIPADEHAVSLAKLLPHAHLNLLAGMGHMFHHFAKDKILEAVARIDEKTQS